MNRKPAPSLATRVLHRRFKMDGNEEQTLLYAGLALVITKGIQSLTPRKIRIITQKSIAQSLEISIIKMKDT